MDTSELTVTEMWLLIALSYDENHAYALSGQISGLSYMGFCPSPQRVRQALRAMARRGLVKMVWLEDSTGVRTARRVYGITKKGRQELEYARRGLAQLAQRIDAVLLRQARLDHLALQIGSSR